MPARDLPPLPPRHTRDGTLARRLLIEDPDINHDAYVGRALAARDHRPWAARDVVAEVVEVTSLDAADPLPDLADRVRVAVAPPWPDGFGPTDEQVAAILAAGQVEQP